MIFWCFTLQLHWSSLIDQRQHNEHFSCLALMDLIKVVCPYMLTLLEHMDCLNAGFMLDTRSTILHRWTWWAVWVCEEKVVWKWTHGNCGGRRCWPGVDCREHGFFGQAQWCLWKPLTSWCWSLALPKSESMIKHLKVVSSALYFFVRRAFKPESFTHCILLVNNVS